MKNLTKVTLALATVFLVGLTSCQKENSLISSSGFADASLNAMQRGLVGKGSCLEFVFPVSVEFVDGTTATGDSYEALHTAIVEWFETNEVEKNKENKPSLVFPIQVLNEDGELIDVADKTELFTLKKECVGKTGNCGDGKGGKGFSCFKLQFPISVLIGEEVQSFDDRQSLKAAVRAYTEEVGKDAPRPELQFPVTVIYEDETTADAASKEELKALKDACDEG